ncbi:MAG: alpha/beta fold hydrolase [Acidimicrobiales bacterium]
MIDFERTGRGAPLVLVHGITESKRTWDPLVQRLADSHEVLAVDLRGHGASAASEPYDVLTMASDIHDVIEASQLGEPLLVGHSLGGTVVSAYAAMFRTRGVINVDQSLRLGDFQQSLLGVEAMLRGDEATFQQMIGMIFEQMRGELDEHEWSRVQSIRRADQEVVLGVWSAVMDLDASELDAMVSALASAIEVPYLSLHGTDPGEDYEEWLRALVMDARVERWAGLGHYPHLVDQDRFLQLVSEFEVTLKNI